MVSMTRRELIIRFVGAVFLSRLATLCLTSPRAIKSSLLDTYLSQFVENDRAEVIRQSRERHQHFLLSGRGHEDEIINDFRDNRVVEVGGWLVAQAELDHLIITHHS